LEKSSKEQQKWGNVSNVEKPCGKE
jgi:hypothetical protein